MELTERDVSRGCQNCPQRRSTPALVARNASVMWPLTKLTMLSMEKISISVVRCRTSGHFDRVLLELGHPPVRTQRGSTGLDLETPSRPVARKAAACEIPFTRNDRLEASRHAVEWSSILGV